MGDQFDKIYESVVERGEVGGYLTGDIVKFVPNYKSSPTYKAMTDEMKAKVDEFSSCGLNCRVVQVGDGLSGASAGNQFKKPQDAVITIALDQGGGRYIEKITVSPDMLSLEPSDGISLPKPSHERDYDAKVQIKPVAVEDEEDDITRVSDPGGPNDRKGKKNRPTDLKLAESTILNNDNDVLGELYVETTQHNQ